MKKSYGANFGTYFKDLFKKGYFLISVLFFVAYVALLTFNYTFKIYYSLQSTFSTFEVGLISGGIFALIIILFLIFATGRKLMTYGDSIGFAMVFNGIATILIGYFINQNFTLRRIIYSGAVFLIGLIFLFIRPKFYDATATKPEVYKGCYIKQYFSSVFGKYSFLGMALALLFVGFTSSLVLSKSMNGVLASLDEIILSTSVSGTSTIIPLTYVLYAAGIAFALFVFFSALKRRTNVADLILIAVVLDTPVMILQALFINFESPIKQTQVLGAIIAGSVALIMMLMRIALLDVNTKNDKKSKSYFVQLFKNYDFFASIAIALIILFIALFLIKGYSNDLFADFLIPETYLLKFISLSVLEIIAIAFIIFVCVAFLMTIINSASPSVNAGDFMTFTLTVLSFVIFLYNVLFGVPDFVVICACTNVFAFGFTNVIIRICVYKNSNKLQLN